ncbi:response regulator [Paenibacillus sp. LHD-38]|uniref:response regulator transcription factor n=1 Tax=Paenibacillus sp. LHD-38 TaxID=3072143 RepID=UPI00280D92C8|nr:response regulator [Paenibacillus sp. LHD-38]MDQ8738139.1 response regulator [Paenibacillus sp. LHD-38]
MLNLLVVDDEPLILAGLRAIIMKAETGFHQVETANDGIEALEMLRSFKPHLILTDIHMPEMTGLELIHEVKNRKLCDRFIILTGYDDFGYARQALRYQVLDYLLKPIDKEELISSLLNAAQSISQELQNSLNQDATSTQANNTTALNLLDGKSLSDQMKRIIDHIHSNYNQDLSLESIAEYIGLTASYVSTLFKREVGINFIPYLHSCRVAKAQQLMNEQPKLAFDKIASQVGYDSPRHFFKVFKKYSGLTPGQYRETEFIEDQTKE